MNIRYLYATVDTVYVFDEQLHILQTQKLSADDVLQIAQNNVSGTEKTLFESYKDQKVYFCNYKEQGFSNLTDLSILQKILDKVQPLNFTQTKKFAYTHVASKLQKYVTWDLHVCQAVRTIDEITKTINLLAKRVREWFEWQLPEFSKKIDSHEYFIQQVAIKGYAELREKSRLYEDVSLGQAFALEDEQTIQSLCTSIKNLIDEQEKLKLYVEKKLLAHAPYFTQIAGSQIGGKLLAMAGSFSRLTKMTSSTIQVLGAEKALFRHLKTGAKPPKYGILFQHKYVSSAKPKNRGRVARMLANTLSLAIKSDYFKSTDFDSTKFLQKIEGALK